METRMAFQVTIQSSGHQFSVQPGESILDAALREGVGLPYGCRNGACGSCMGRVVDGRICYEDGNPPALGDDDAARDLAAGVPAHPVRQHDEAEIAAERAVDDDGVLLPLALALLLLGAAARLVLGFLEAEPVDRVRHRDRVPVDRQGLCR